MIATKPKKKRIVQPEFRLAGRFLVLVYTQFEVLGKQAMVLNYRAVAERFQSEKFGPRSWKSLEFGMTDWLWSIFSVRSRNYNNREETEIWKFSKAQAERFVEENRDLFAEMELST